MQLKLAVALLSLLSVETFGTKNLFFKPRHGSRSSERCCDSKNIKSCENVAIDSSISKSFDTHEDLFIEGKVFSFSNKIEPNGFTYKTEEGDETVITLNQKTGNMFANLMTADGKSFALEKCSGGHVWKEFDVGSFKPEYPIELELTKKSRNMMKNTQDAKDVTTVATYSIMFYYTPEFAAITEDIPGFIDQVIAETNQGYENSEVPIRVTKFCSEAATINDQSDPGALLMNFANMKGSAAALRNTADAAALLVANTDACGVAYLGTYIDGWTVSLATKDCAVGYYSF